MRSMQNAMVTAPQRDDVRRPQLSERKEAGIVETKMTIPVIPEARKELCVLERPAWRKTVGAY